MKMNPEMTLLMSLEGISLGNSASTTHYFLQACDGSRNAFYGRLDLIKIRNSQNLFEQRRGPHHPRLGGK